MTFIRVGQRPETLKLLPQVGQGRPPGVKRQILSHALGHHAEPPVLARENGAERALGDELPVRSFVARGGSNGGAGVRPLDVLFLLLLFLPCRASCRPNGGQQS